MDVKNPLNLLPAGSLIFIDANIFLYSILGHPTFRFQSKKFLELVENGKYECVISTLVLNEIMHKLMLAETAKINRLNSEREALRMIKESPGIVYNLSLAWINYMEIKKISNCYFQH